MEVELYEEEVLEEGIPKEEMAKGKAKDVINAKRVVSSFEASSNNHVDGRLAKFIWIRKGAWGYYSKL